MKKVDFHCYVGFPEGTSDTKRLMLHIPRCSMCGIFTYVCHKIKPHVGKYAIHGASGMYTILHILTLHISAGNQLVRDHICSKSSCPILGLLKHIS